MLFRSAPFKVFVLLAGVAGVSPLRFALGIGVARLARYLALGWLAVRYGDHAIELMKTTTLVATIAYADLLYAANEISQKTFRPLETFTVAALIYFVVITAFSVIARRCERRLAVSGEATVH